MLTPVLRSLSARSRVISTEAARIGDRRVNTISQQPKKPTALQNNHNCRMRRGTMKSFGWIVMSALAVFLVATSTSWAQPLDCENDRSIGACVGELLDEQLETIDEVENMLMDMEAMNMFSFGREQFGLAAQGGDPQADLFARIETLRNQHARAKAANEATTEDEFEEMIVQGDMEKGKKCKFSDKAFFDSLDGADPPGLLNAGPKFGDGKCNTFMANDVDDPMGMKVRVNERKENMCERVCEVKMNQMGKSKERFVNGMVDALSSARSAKESLSTQRASMLEQGFLLSDLRLSEDDFQLSQAADACDPGTPGPGDDLTAIQALNITITALDAVLVAGNIITEVLKTIADIADKPCQQDAAGFNASAACIPFTVAFHVSKGLFGVVGGAKSILGDTKSIIVTAAKIKSAFKADSGIACSKIIKDDTDMLIVQVSGLQVDVDDLKVKAGEANAELAAIRAELALVMSLLEATRDLLLTPPGRREGFNP